MTIRGCCWRSLGCNFRHTSLRASLISKGGVLIGINILIREEGGKELSWQVRRELRSLSDTWKSSEERWMSINRFVEWQLERIDHFTIILI